MNNIDANKWDSLTAPYDFENVEEMTNDLWLFLAGDKMPTNKGISKPAFVHEIKAMLASMKGHYENQLQEWREECERLAGVVEFWQKQYNDAAQELNKNNIGIDINVIRKGIDNL